MLPIPDCNSGIIPLVLYYRNLIFIYPSLPALFMSLLNHKVHLNFFFSFLIVSFLIIALLSVFYLFMFRFCTMKAYVITILFPLIISILSFTLKYSCHQYN